VRSVKLYDGTDCLSSTGETGGWGSWRSPVVGGLVSPSDAGGEGAGASAGDVYEFFIGGELVESREQAFGLGEQFVVVVTFDLQEDVVDAEVIVAHGANEIRKIGGLAGEAFENIDELRGGVVERVVEIGFVFFRALFVEQGFCAKIGEAAVDF